MATYATTDDCKAYTEGLRAPDDEVLERLIERAERDVDRLHVLTTREAGSGGLRVPDTAELTERQRDGLMRATCAQVEYRVRTGEEDLQQHTARRVQGPDFTVERAPLTDYSIGPRVRHELRMAGILRTTATAL